MPMCDVIIVTMISRMLCTVTAIVINSKRLLMIVSMLVLHLKAAEPYPESSKVQRNLDYEM